MTSPSKWELLLEKKPVPLLEHLLAQSAELFAADLAAWPPPLEGADEKVAELLRNSPIAPVDALYRGAFTLARFDVLREFEASDDFLRNQRWLTPGLTAMNKTMLLFLSRLMTEQLYGLAEATQGRVTRRHLIAVLEDTEKHFFAHRGAR